MTRASPITVFLEASPFYVDEPDIPEGMTCATWRRRRQPRKEPGLFARVRVRRLAVLCVRSLGLASGSNGAIDPRME